MSELKVLLSWILTTPETDAGGIAHGNADGGNNGVNDQKMLLLLPVL